MPLPKRLGGHDESTQSLLNRAYNKTLNVLQFMVFGTSNGSDAVAFKTDTDGHLQVDVLSGGGGGTLKNDGEAMSATDTGGLIAGTDGVSAQFMSVDSNGRPNVNAKLSAGTNSVGKISVIQNANTKVSAIQLANSKVSAIMDLAIAKAVDNITASLSSGTNIVGKISAFQRALAKATDNVTASISAGANIVGKVSAIQLANSKVSAIMDLALAKAVDNVSASLSAGTNIVGKISAFQRALAKATDNVTASISAGANIVGKVSAIQNANTKVSIIAAGGAAISAFQAGDWYTRSGYAYIDATNTAIQYSSVTFNHVASGSASVVAASAGKEIRVVNIDMTVAASGNVGWKGGTTKIVNNQYFPKNSGKEQNYHPGWMCQTASGSALYIITGSAVSARGVVGFYKF